MKRLLCFLLCLCMIVVLVLSSCTNKKVENTDSSTEDTAPSTSVETEKIQESTEPHESKIINKDELGMVAYLAQSDKPMVAKVKTLSDGGVELVSYNPGNTVITVKNSYGECVNISVEVSDDYSFGKVEFEKFKMPERYVYATDFGVSPSNPDNTKALQKAINSLAYGGVVYIPKGIYYVGIIDHKANVSIKLEGILENYNTELDAALAKRIYSGEEFAVIRPKQNDMFANHKAGDWGRNGADNISFSGGVIDMAGRTRAFIWCCADGVTLENTILKDCPNNHAIQVTGCINVNIRNVMFGGYNYTGSTGGGEVLQIELSHPNAIGGTVYSKFDTNECFICENVVVENCYFGKSEKYDAPTYAIGQHGHGIDVAVRGLKILNCTFDNPRVNAIRAFAYTDVEIAGCKFISKKENGVLDSEQYMIELCIQTGDVKGEAGAYITTKETRGGCSDYKIHDNTFVIGKYSKMHGVITNRQSGIVGCDARARGGISILGFYTMLPKYFTGYQLVNNHISNIQMYNNNITIENEYGTNIYKFSSVKGLYIADNKVTTERNYNSVKLNGVQVLGLSAAGCTDMKEYENEFKVQLTPDNKTVPLVLVSPDGRTTEVYCTAKSDILSTFKAFEGGTLEKWVDADGVLYIKAVVKDGYRFDGFYFGNTNISAERYEMPIAMLIGAQFTKLG